MYLKSNSFGSMGKLCDEKCLVVEGNGFVFYALEISEFQVYPFLILKIIVVFK